MPLYPFCVIGDVQKYNLNQEQYGATTRPTSTQVNDFMLEVYADLLGVVESAGYDTDNLFETSSTVALAIVATGSAVTVALTSATGFSKGDVIKVEGLTSGLRALEYVEISNVSGSDITAIFANSYDAGSTIKVVNIALQILRRINSVGAAWKADESTFMGTAPNLSEHAESLKKLYFGDEDNQTGLWAIKNLPEYLKGATKLDTTISRRPPISSYGEQHSTDTDVQPEFTKDMEF